MSLAVRSVCGATTIQIDVEDLDLNADGIACCANCVSIQQARQAWLDQYQPDKHLHIPAPKDESTLRWLYDQALQEA